MEILVPWSKKQLLEKLLSGTKVAIQVSTQAAGVDIPQVFKNNPSVLFNLSWKFNLPMEIDDWGIHATLTFSGIPYACKIPWKAIFVITPYDTEIPYVSVADIPERYNSSVELPKDKPEPAKKKTPFSVIKGGKNE